MIMLDAIDDCILKMLSNGYSRPEIAETLGFSVSKTDYRIQLLMHEFGCHNAAHLVAEAFRKGILEP